MDNLNRARSIDGVLSPEHLARVDRLIQEKLSERLAIRDLGASVGLSAFHFCRIFRNATGQSPHQYLVAKRIEEARRILISTELPLVGVARHVGFRTQAHFTKVFRALTGSTPGAYRRNAQTLAPIHTPVPAIPADMPAMPAQAVPQPLAVLQPGD
jgi:AraC family transcriptional regulator